MVRKLVIPIVLLALTPGAQADAFKCRTTDGRIVISSAPCEEGSKTMAVESGEVVAPERRLQAEKEAERQRRLLADQDAARAVQERQEEQRQHEARRRLAEEEIIQRAQCRQKAQEEPDPQLRADLIAACNGVAPQRAAVTQQPVLFPVVPLGKLHRSDCPAGDCFTLQDKGASKAPPSTPPAQSKSSCREVNGRLRCY